MQKASFEVLHPSTGRSFLLTTYDELAFTAPYHFHPEYELTLITEGSGRRYIGSHIGDFTAGDLVLVGPNLPHCWKLEQLPAADPAGAIVIQFASDFLGQDFFTRAECMPMHKLLQHSSCGILFLEKTAAGAGERIRSLAGERNDFRRLISFLEILHELALSRNSTLLDPGRIALELAPVDQERIHPIFAYLVENFRSAISLDKAAAIAGMTPNAFCRYFKKITRKTFVETVIEYRLNHATRQLTQTDQSISSICYDSGFGDISHFYKTFRSKMHLSPLHYRKKFMQETSPTPGDSPSPSLTPLTSPSG